MKARILLVDTNDNLIGQPDYAKYNKLPWYKKLYAFFNRKYKRKHMSVKGYGCEIIVNVTSEDGEPITGLKKEDFVLISDGDEINLDEFDKEGYYFIDN